MNIKDAKEQIKNAMIAYFAKDEFGNYVIPVEKQRPVFMIGAPGIGKTAIMEQIAEELGVGLVSYSMTHHTRQSALGLPFIVKKNYGGREYDVSEYTMSEIIASVYDLMEETGYREGILFLDEINCVSETLAPAMLQFLQYKTFGRHSVPSGWIVVTAGNPPEYNKSVREFDVATWDRLKRIDVGPDFGVWKEYASKKGVHSSILTFLEIKKDYFYVVETAVNRRSFVTARGWEDLSEMIKLYEAKDIKVDLKLVEQYLQNAAIAKEFSIYYDLYNKYRSDYQINGILDGRTPKGIATRARNARFDERLSLLGMLVETVDSEMRACVLDDAAILECLSLLKEFKKSKDRKKPYTEILDGYTADEREKENRMKRAGTLSDEQKYCCEYAASYIQSAKDAARAQGITDNGEAFGVIKEKYDATVSEHKAAIENAKQRLDNLFAFVETTFATDNEMVILVTELTVRYYSAKFISRFGCDSYFRHNKGMLFYEREKEIASEIEYMNKDVTMM